MAAAFLISLLLSFLAVIFGLVSVYIGLRGKRLGDHPVCAACGYDLFGQPPGSERPVRNAAARRKSRRRCASDNISAAASP